MKRKPNNRTGGFTMVEALAVLTLGSMLTHLGVGGFIHARQAYGLSSSQTVFASALSLTRAHAVERGSHARLEIDTDNDEVRVVFDGQVLESIDFQDQFGVDLTASVSNPVVCMGPGGYADSGCNSFSGELTVDFHAGAEQATTRILQLGQLLD